MSRKLALLLVATFVVGGLAISLGSIAGVVDAARRGPDRAASYINPDTGLATENPDVKPNSECKTPDQKDRQTLSPAGTTTNNVHNDGCLFKGNKKFDGPVSYVISGVGTFSACPDPDNAGPKTSAIKDGGTRCYETGWQDKGTDGDKEFHARINNDSTPGVTKVVLCHDPNDNGCADARVKDSITITWVS